MLRTKKIVRSIRGGMKYIRIILSSFLIAFGLLLFVNFASSFFFKSSLFSAYIVQSGSMEPAIKTGSLVISLPSKNYSQNDVITYKDGKKLVTHRIEAKIFPEGVYNDPIYMTSGDANKVFDRIKLSQDQIVGKVLFSVPYLGYIADFAKTPKGFILFVVIPATIIVYEELKFLFNSIISRIREKFKKNCHNNFTSIGINSKLIAVIPIFGAIIVFVGLTNSFFLDSEISSQNVFQAAVFATPTSTPTPTPTSTPTPTPTLTQGPGDVVINEIMWQGSSDEWIELRNMTSQAIDISQWTIENAASSSNPINISPSTTLAAGGLYLIAKNKNSSTINIDPDQTTASVSMLDGGEVLTLKTNTSQTIDTAFTGSGWFFSASTPRKSVERKNSPGDGTVSSNWQTATTHTNMDGSTASDEFGTPKAANGL